MSGQGVISEMPDFRVPVEGTGLGLDQGALPASKELRPTFRQNEIAQFDLL
jgi:hypothetical protein